MSIVGQTNVTIYNSYQYVAPISTSYFWEVERGFFIGADNQVLCNITPTNENCIIKCTLGNGDVLTLHLTVCIPNTQGSISSNIPIITNKELQFTFEGNGNNLSYFWEVEGGLIISSNNLQNVIVVFTQENAVLKVTVNNCVEFKTERIINACVKVEADIQGEIEIPSVEELYNYTASNLTGTLPYMYTWIVRGGDVIFGQGTNLIQVRWKQAEQHSVMLNIQNCGGFQQKTLDIEMGIIRSATLKIGTECLERCIDVHGFSLPRSVIKLYNNNNILIDTVTADGRGVYKFCDVCNEKSVYVTQTEINKAESERSNIISRCKECDVEPKIYIKNVCNPKPTNRECGVQCD